MRTRAARDKPSPRTVRARDNDKHADTVVRWVERQVAQGKIERAEFGHRALTIGVRGARNVLSDPKALENALSELVQRSYLREIKGKPRAFLIHPNWWEEMNRVGTDPTPCTRITHKTDENVGNAGTSRGVSTTENAEWDCFGGMICFDWRARSHLSFRGEKTINASMDA